jgi:ABC-type multidrug transport system ATPase subunit
VSGYVEQFDTLFPYSTVRETLMFAARLRLPRAIPDNIKTKIVDEIIDILDLGSMQDYLIGSAGMQGLSPAQVKRVNIGVELVANPAILFLDEPTTGMLLLYIKLSQRLKNLFISYVLLYFLVLFINLIFP